MFTRTALTFGSESKTLNAAGEAERAELIAVLQRVYRLESAAGDEPADGH